MARSRPHPNVLRVVCAIAAPIALASGQAMAEPVDSGDLMIRTVTGRAIRGEIVSAGSRDIVIQGADAADAETIAWPDVIELENPGATAVAPTGSYRVDLANGDRLFGSPVGFEQDRIRLETSELGTWSIPLADVSIWRPITRSLRRGPTLAARSRPSCWLGGLGTDLDDTESRLRQDRLELANGDILEGIITRIDEHGVSILTDGGKRENSLSHQAVRLARLMALDSDASPSLGFRFITSQGCIVTTPEVRWDAPSASWELQNEWAEPVHLGMDQWVRLEMVGGRWEWLSSHKPISFEHRPMISLGWTYRNDANVTGGPMIVDGRAFEHGIGVHGATWLNYDLKSEYETFVTYYGLDDDSGSLADVDIVVRVDGQVRHVDHGVTARHLMGPIRIDVRNASRLELAVEYGKNGDVQDRFNWADAALIRSNR